MTSEHLLDGTGEDIPGHRVLEGTDLEIAYNLQGDDLVIRVNKDGLLVFRVMLRDAATEMSDTRLINFNTFAPDLVFTIGDTEEGLRRVLASASMAYLTEQPWRGFFRWLLHRA